MLCSQGSALETVYDFNLLKVDETRVRAAPRVGQALVHCDLFFSPVFLSQGLPSPDPSGSSIFWDVPVGLRDLTSCLTLPLTCYCSAALGSGFLGYLASQKRVEEATGARWYQKVDSLLMRLWIQQCPLTLAI